MKVKVISIVLTLFGITSCTADAPADSTGFRTSVADAAAQARVDASAVVAWNALAYQIAFAEDQLLTFKGLRAFAMMHLAMHDALNTINPLFARYAYAGELTPAVHPTTAAAQAAYEVLLSQYPGARAQLDAELARWTGLAANAPPRVAAIRLGKAAAAAVLTRRGNDGWNASASYEFQTGPGQYQTTPPFNGFVLAPGFRLATPFALAAPAAFRPPPPPLLSTPAYATALNEVKSLGAAGSAARTAEQTSYALWWMEFAEGSVNRLARELVGLERANLWVAARLLAHLNMSLFDAYIAVWDAKFEYNHWRPYTAIRAAADDGNAATEPDAAWEPLRPTPPFPEYVSAHAAGCAASFDILQRAFGDALTFTMQTITAPPEMPKRSFARFSAAATECADSRVRLGWHFRYATDAGADLGRQVSTYIAGHALGPVRRGR